MSTRILTFNVLTKDKLGLYQNFYYGYSIVRYSNSTLKGLRSGPPTMLSFLASLLITTLSAAIPDKKFPSMRVRSSRLFQAQPQPRSPSAECLKLSRAVRAKLACSKENQEDILSICCINQAEMLYFGILSLHAFLLQDLLDEIPRKMQEEAPGMYEY